MAKARNCIDRPVGEQWAGMQSEDPIEQRLRDELAWARAEEAEALRRSHHLRAIGSLEDIREATQQVELLHSRITTLQRQLHELLPA